MRLKCRRGHLHYSEAGRDECNDSRDVEDDGPVAIPTYPIPLDLSPDVAPTDDEGPEYEHGGS